MSALGMALERRALSLGAANAFDYAVQFLLPVVLVRTLDPESFGHYRLLWLLVATALMFTNFAMPQSLNYFLPRVGPRERRLYVHQTAAFISFTGLVAGLALWAYELLMPQALGGLAGHGLLVPAFISLWVAASLLDSLPTVDEDVAWQAKSTIGLSVLRALALSLAAVLTGDLTALLFVLLAFSAFKLVLLLRYVERRHGLAERTLDLKRLWNQFKHAAPFGVSGMLHALRHRADHWVAAAMFSAAKFAAFSVAAVLAPLVMIFRHSVNRVFLPSMSRLQAQSNLGEMLALNSRANLMVGVLAYPALAFCFAFAEPLVELIYTREYLDAVPVMRVYIFGLMVFVVELQSIMLLLREGLYQARVNMVNLAVSVALSLGAALVWGLPGAAVGSVTAAYFDRIAVLIRISRVTGVPLARLQDWRSLLGLLAAAAVSAWIVYELGARAQLSQHPFVLLGVSAALMALAYPLALLLAGQRELLSGFLRLVAIRRQAHGAA